MGRPLRKVAVPVRRQVVRPIPTTRRRQDGSVLPADRWCWRFLNREAYSWQVERYLKAGNARRGLCKKVSAAGSLRQTHELSDDPFRPEKSNKQQDDPLAVPKRARRA